MALKPDVDRQWDERYQSKTAPWVHEIPHGPIIELAENYLPEKSRLLEVGCGLGEEANALAHLGFEVVAIDLSPVAIEQAKKQHKATANLTFKTADIFDSKSKLGCYDAVVDVCCLHTFAVPDNRRLFVDKVAEHLSAKGIWINMSCALPAVEEVERKTGVEHPPAINFLELAQAVTKHFTILTLVSSQIPISRPGFPTTDFPVWISVFKKLI